jgi:ubiquinone/menaquinone biosynthesis C-methylase UbiE
MRKLSHKLHPGKDLTETQSYITLQTFNKNAKEYAEKWEWSSAMTKEIVKYNIKPFLQFVKPGNTCLIAGCQSGRDYSILSKKGMKCVGVSWSYGLLKEAQIRVPDGIFLFADLRNLPFMSNGFDAIYADALTRIPRKDVKQVLKDFRVFLKDGGYLYLSFRVGEEGVYQQDDSVGKRYMTMFDEVKLVDMIKNSGFNISWKARSEHLKKSLPNWLSLVVKKE